MYPLELLEEYDSYYIEDLSDYEETFYAFLSGEMVGVNEFDAFSDRIIDTFFGKKGR